VSDIFNILATNYSTVGTTPNIKSKYVAVDPKLFEGTWTGKYGDNTKFSVTISQVDGFRAKVKFVGDGKTQYSQVLIRDNAFRIGDSKFQVTGKDVAQVATAVVDPTTGTTSVGKSIAKRTA
jgi:hypothetical protein